MKKRKDHPVCGKCGQMTHGLPDDIDKHAEIILGQIRCNKMCSSELNEIGGI
jgi:hypothetical protein